MHKAYLLLGGNLGNRLANLQQAQRLIEKHCGSILQSSSIYQTAAWGLQDQPDFYNQVILIQTKYPPEALMQKLLQIEANMGRERIIKMGPRTIDLDILLIDKLIVNTDLVVIPHPALTKRRFALIPLNEIAATIVHPVEKKRIHELLQVCPDTLDVQKIKHPA